MQFKETMKKIGSKAKTISQKSVRAVGTGTYFVGNALRRVGLKLKKVGLKNTVSGPTVDDSVE